MNNTKTLFAAALIAACAISQPVLADVTESATLPTLNTLALESADLNFAFEQSSQPLQMATLPEQEMDETEGAYSFLNWSPAGIGASALLGASIGGISYTTSAFGARSPWRFNEFAGSVVGGFLGGYSSRINWTSFRF